MSRPTSRGVFTEALEERVLCALSKAAGGSGCSGTLSTNLAIRQQQLICDPTAPVLGSTSVSYDAQVVTLVDARPGPGYANEGFQVLVEVTVLPPVITLTEFEPNAVAAAEPGTTLLVPFSQFDDSRTSYRETGYVQVKYQLIGEAGQLALDEGFVENDSAGVDGVDTHELFFSPLFNPNEQVAAISPSLAIAADVPAEGLSYTVFAAPPGSHSGNAADFFVTDATQGSKTIPWYEISPAVVSTAPISAKPVASMTAAAETCNGPVGVTLFATDPSPSDTAAGFTYLLDWGDGTLQTISASAFNGAGTPASHDYQDVGTFTITLRAVDQHDEASEPFSTKVQVGGAELQPDPSDPSKLVLHVCGSEGDDVIGFEKAGAGLGVSINGQNFGPFTGFDRVIVFGGSGDDDVRMTAQGAYPVLLFGGAGDDTLVAGNGPGILSGGDGIDRIAGGNGADLLIGGRGGDRIEGGNGEDILVAGWTAYDGGTDADVRALTSILTEWTRGGRYETRIDHLTGVTPGGLNSAGTFRLSGPGQDVFDDGASDRLLGGTGRDWLVVGAGDNASDLARNEIASAV
jgi:hypothetical protein